MRASWKKHFQHAVRHGVLIVAAAGNQGVLGSSVITRHPWVIAVAAYAQDGRPLPDSNLGRSTRRVRILLHLGHKGDKGT